MRRTSFRLRAMYSSLARSKLSISHCFLHVSTNQAGTGEVLLGAGGNVGEHGLNALKALMNSAAEILHYDAEDGQRQEGRTTSTWG